MPGLKPITDDPAAFSRSRLMVARARVPPDLELGRVLGRGSNNKVFRATWKEQECVLRAPRRRSDTQQRGSAVWEFRHTLKASQLGVGPAVYDAWVARHASGDWPAGLYVITERLPHDLDAVLGNAELRAALPAKAVGEALVRCLNALADADIFVYDLKPSNVMVRPREDGGVDARIIDFGRDFCEWSGCEQEPDSKAPVTTLVRKLLQARGEPEGTIRSLTRHVLFAAMLVQLAATTTRQLYEDRGEHRMDAAARAEANPLADSAVAMLDSMQGRNLALLREVLRTDEVRGVLQHYHGRRCAGTRRTLRYARGGEW